MRLGFKALIVALLALAILVPLAMIHGTIGERQAYRDEAVRSVARSYAGAQRIAGPVLVVPYVESVVSEEKDAQGATRQVRRDEARQWIFFPAALSTAGVLKPSTRHLGLHEVRVYEFEGAIAARFDAAIPADDGAQRRIGRPWLAYGFDDTGKIDTQDGRQRMARMTRTAAAYLQVQRIDAACLDAHQHLARTRDRTRHRGNTKRRAVALQNGSVHGTCMCHGQDLIELAAKLYPCNAHENQRNGTTSMHNCMT